MAKYYDKKSDKIVGISNDESRKFTRECITTAIVKLMKVKEYSKITVTDICEKAGVSRAGFYRNFKDKEDVMKEVLANANVNSGLSLQEMSKLKLGVEESWLYIIKAVTERRGGFAAIMEILETGQGNVLINHINKLADSTFIGGMTVEGCSVISAYFWSGALINLMTYWLKNGQKETPEELVDFIMNCLYRK